MTGQRFGSLVAFSIDREKTRRGRTYWFFKCDCGTVVSISRDHMRNGERTSCGCKTEHSTRFKERHGLSFSAEHRAWARMKSDCFNPKTERFHNYGGRGITVAKEWVDNFEAFYAHIGPRPSSKHSVDRIDVEGNYEPGNVRWATLVEQCRNRRNNIHATINGDTKCVSEWCDLLGIKRNLAYQRIRKGWDPAKAILTPRMINRTRKETTRYPA